MFAFSGWTGLNCSIPDCGSCGHNGFCNGSTDPPLCNCKEVSVLQHKHQLTSCMAHISQFLQTFWIVGKYDALSM